MEKITMTKKRTTLSTQEAFDLFIKKCEAKNLSTATIESYKRDLKHFFEFRPSDEPINCITPETINDYTLWLKKNTVANAISINSYLRAIRAFLYWAMDNGHVAQFKVHLVKAEKKIKTTYTNDDLLRLLEKPDMDKCTFSCYKTWVFENYLLGTGNRISTALEIRIGDIDFRNGVVTLRRTKNRRQQIIPLSMTLSEILQEYLQVRGGEPDDFLFCNEYGAQASNRTYQQLVKRYNKRRGVEVTSCHAFRHSFAKAWILNGGDVFRLKNILGHSDISVTQEYVHMFAPDLQMDFEKFNPLDSLKEKGNNGTIKMK